jgi:hypothetical protein
MTRAATEARAAEEKRKNAPAFPLLDVLGGCAVLAGVFYLGLSWHRAREEPPRPAGAPLIRPPDPVTPSTPATLATFSVALAEPVAAESPREAMTLAPGPTPSPFSSESLLLATLPSSSPSPSPSPTAKPERSELDVRREQGEQRLEQTLARLQGDVTRLSANARQFQSICLGTHGDASSCERLFREISSSATTLDRGLQEAEEDARRAWVVPGLVRDLRQRHGLDEATWSELSAMVRRLETTYHGKP